MRAGETRTHSSQRETSLWQEAAVSAAPTSQTPCILSPQSASASAAWALGGRGVIGRSSAPAQALNGQGNIKAVESLQRGHNNSSQSLEWATGIKPEQRGQCRRRDRSSVKVARRCKQGHRRATKRFKRSSSFTGNRWSGKKTPRSAQQESCSEASTASTASRTSRHLSGV